MSNKTICDGCKSDISETINSIDYRIILSTEITPCWNGAVTDMMIPTPLDKIYHFCGIGCLKKVVSQL